MTAYLRRKIIKFSVYAIIIYVLYILQSTPGFLEVCNTAPILVLPACVCLAVYEGGFAAGIFGFFAGLLCDCAAETVFGFNALFCMAICVGTGLVFIYMLRRSVLNVMLVSLLAIFSRSVFEFFFTFVIYDYNGLSQFFYTVKRPAFAAPAAGRFGGTGPQADFFCGTTAARPRPRWPGSSG